MKIFYLFCLDLSSDLLKKFNDEISLPVEFKKIQLVKMVVILLLLINIVFNRLEFFLKILLNF
jgi:hypothetical protein